MLNIINILKRDAIKNELPITAVIASNLNIESNKPDKYFGFEYKTSLPKEFTNGLNESCVDSVDSKNRTPKAPNIENNNM